MERRAETDMQAKLPQLVAHRGVPSAMPENTLIGFEAALCAGARYLELDVQLSSDGVPVLYHDADTARISGAPGSVLDRSLEEIRSLRASHAERFGRRYRDNPVATLSEFLELISARPEVTVFVELKRESLQRFGTENTVDAVFAAVNGLKDRVVFISFEDEAVRYAGTVHGVRIGWVLPAWTQENAGRAAALMPQYLLCDREFIPRDDRHLWPGPWEWVAYVVDEPAEAVALFRRGIRFVETDNIIEMLRHPLLGRYARRG